MTSKSDRAFRVTWKAGETIVHAGDEKEAREVAIEYIRATNLLEARLDLGKAKAAAN